MADNKSIKFPKQHYVGFQARPSVDDLPLAFMTPEGTDKAAMKRKATVDTWAAGSGYYGSNQAKEKLPAQVFDNVPLIGFKMGRNVSHGYGWGKGDVKWRIADPRGFELEISSPNFAQILGFCTLEKGEIQEECVWARLGNENILVPVNSDVYDNTVRNTERMSKKASMRDIKIGDHAVMHNGEEGVYYGAMYVVSTKNEYGQHYNYSSSRESTKVLGSTGKKRHVFLMQQPESDGVSSRKFFKAIGSPKVSEKFDALETWTLEESETKINQMIADGMSISEGSTGYASEEAVSLKDLTVEDFSTVIEPVSIQAAVDWCKANSTEYNAGYGHRNYYVQSHMKGMTLLELPDGRWVEVDVRQLLDKRDQLAKHPNAPANYNPAHYHNTAYDEIHLDEVDKNHWDHHHRIRYITKQVNNPNYNSWYHNSRTNTVVISEIMKVSDVPDMLFRLKEVAQTDQGTEIAYYV